MFGKKSKKIIINGQEVELQPKPSPFSKLFSAPAKKTSNQAVAPQSNPTVPQQPSQIGANAQQSPPPQTQIPPQNTNENMPGFSDYQLRAAKLKMKPPSKFQMYLEGVGAKSKGLENAMRAQGMKISMYQFIRNMMIVSIILAFAVGIAIFILFESRTALALPLDVIFAILIGIVVYMMAFQSFLNYPKRQINSAAKNVERDILFAARDMIISLRSGLPLFNAITSISTGYGDASKEFAKIVEKVQIGTPLEDAIDQTVADSKSPSFKRIMIQAAVSIRAGADVTSALQSVIDQLSQERVIELRRYGQRLNAIAMFYMLFGIIVPSMGIAVLSILTTFIAIFTIDFTVLEFALVGIFFLQIIFLLMVTSSRPVFSM